MDLTICYVCNDTHIMPEAKHMCVYCPVPCQSCRNGAFCKKTPCDCKCHKDHYQYKHYHLLNSEVVMVPVRVYINSKTGAVHDFDPPVLEDIINAVRESVE